jgi:glycosyltransferase involved in cell wall biosynthesis
MSKGKKILIDCERMKYLHTGLYHYCAHLSRALIGVAGKNELCFYVPKKLENIFGKDNCYITQQASHKLLLPSLKDIVVWHSTHQSTDYYPYRKKVKIVLTIHDLNYLYDESKSEKKKKKYINDIQQKIDRADHIVAISKFSLKDVETHFKLNNKPISVIYNGCNIEEIKDTTKPAYIPDKPFLFTIGTIVEKKNFHVLPPLLKNNDWNLIIAGITHSENYKEEIIANAKKHGVAERLIFTGPVSENDKQWLYQNCKAFVFPSISEGFGLPVIEAMYFGKPVLLSNYTSLPEIGGNAAYYFDSFNAETMQHILTESLHDYEINHRSVIIKERAALFNWKESALQYLNVYHSLV